MASGKTIAVACVGGVATIAAYYTNRQMSSVLDRNPFIVQAVEALHLNPANISYWKLVHQDSVNNVAYATVTVEDKKIRICAKHKMAPGCSSLPPTPDGASVYDDLEAEGSGLAFYWENPWEIKASLIRAIRQAADTVKSWTGSVVSSDIAELEKGPWELITVVIDDTAVIGDKLSHPDFASAAQLGINGMKSEESKNRAKFFLATLTGTALLLGAKRGYTNYRLWPSYVFARNYVTKHPLVSEFFQGEVEVVTRTGLFEARKIEAEITIAGKAQSGESVVRFCASRSGNGQWTVSQALMTPTGCKPIDLLAGRPPSIGNRAV